MEALSLNLAFQVQILKSFFKRLSIFKSRVQNFEEIVHNKNGDKSMYSHFQKLLAEM